MRRALPAIAVAALLSVSACSGDGPTTSAAEAPNQPVATPSLPPTCKTLFVVGKAIDEAAVKPGCTDDHGTVTSASGFSCNDGRMLFQMDASSGAPAGWGFSGGKYTASRGDIAADPKYKAAYEKCQG